MIGAATSAPASVASVAEAGAGHRLAPTASEYCWECQQPISRHEYVRALVLRSDELAGFVHVIACSDRIASKCETYAEYRALNARLVDLG